ncbi:hypothetical protein H6P81_020215 [Aristolochia fimbriata]|uniref:PUM-HD domain-containing protein n=1 Tax=Aristolochia fimbriata TaxID=158543 RepID=A0AAV7DVQ1_ARIFI|nr:hypothetical protein H6P81_020215 [Aristolochia fimbriata]
MDIYGGSMEQEQGLLEFLLLQNGCTGKTHQDPLFQTLPTSLSYPDTSLEATLAVLSLLTQSPSSTALRREPRYLGFDPSFATVPDNPAASFSPPLAVNNGLSFAAAQRGFYLPASTSPTTGSLLPFCFQHQEALRTHQCRGHLCTDGFCSDCGRLAHSGGTDYHTCLSRLQSPLFRSPLLGNEFRWGIVHLAMQQEGWRLLQKVVDDGRPDDLLYIFLGLKSHLLELMVDPFGNYFVQKLVEVCNDQLKMEIVLLVTQNRSNFVRICLDMHGTRSVQSLLENLRTPQQKSQIIGAIVPLSLFLIKDLNGHHVVQHCFEHFSNNDNKWLSVKIAQHCTEIAMNKSGCCVLQRCLGKVVGDQKEHLISEITSNALLLSEDRFGNYVVQFLLDQMDPVIPSNLVRQLEGKFATLSMQKFSSNVVEKCLRVAGEELSAKIIRELLESRCLLQVLQDRYGNFVMQCAWSVSKGHIHHAIENAIQENLCNLSAHPYGKNVVARINLNKRPL